MRRIAKPCMVIVLALLMPAPLPAQQVLRWEVSLDNAKRLAAQSNRLVLAHFTADWCGVCRTVEAEVHTQPQVIAAIDANYVAVKINVDNFPQTARQYGITMLPTEVIIAPTPQGEAIDVMQGRVKVDSYLTRLNQVAANVKRNRQAVVAQVAAGPAMTPPATPGPALGPAPTTRPTMPAGMPAGMPGGIPAGTPSGMPVGNLPVAVAPGMPPAVGPAGLVAASSPGVVPAATSAAPPPAVAPAHDASPIALDGFCPVQLVEKANWQPGNRAWGARHRGRTYLFVGPEEQRRFLADPDRYAPINSGNDLILSLEQGRHVPGNREHGVYFAGRVYLFSEEGTLQKFSGNPKFYADQALQAMKTGPSANILR